MQTLGLASEQKPTDGLLKRLFWPTIENQYDVELVRQQGFWLCTVVAILSTIMLMASGSVLAGVLVGVTYLLGGMGVREGNIGASVLIFICYLFDRVGAALMGLGAGNPLLGLFVLALLLSNIRATILSRRWQRETGNEALPEEDPERSSSSFTDTVSNVVPAAVWPKAQYVFFPLAGGLLLLTVVGMLMLPGIQRRRAANAEQQRQQMEITVPVR